MQPMIRSIFIPQLGQIQNIATDQIATALSREDGFLWVDMVSEAAETSKSILNNVFQFHPLSIDDALLEKHVPKVDEWDTYLYIVLRTVKMDHQDIAEICTPELDIFLGANYVVTYHEEPLAAVEKIWELCHQDQRYLLRGASYLLYHIADEIVTNTITVIDGLDDWIDQIEDEIFTDSQPGTLEQIFSVKRVVLRLRRTLLPQREVFNKLARGDFDLIPEIDRIYFRDVYDHMLRLHEINEGSRDLIGGALDTYLSVVNNRMNEVMKVLTVIATVFIPLSFIVGLYGMNFSYMPELKWKWGYFGVWAVIILVVVGMLTYFRRKKWL